MTANCHSASLRRRSTIGSPATLLTVLVLGLALTGCGHTGKTESPSAHASATSVKPQSATATAGVPSTTSTEANLKIDSDEDNDNPTSAHYDADDNVVLSYGQAASEADRRAIADVVRRYYMAAVAGDGAKGCSLVYSLLVETAPEDLSQTPREGETCSQAMSKFFKRDHTQFKADTTRIKLTRARVHGDSGLALVRLGTRERRVLVHREGGVWKVNTLLDMGVP